jgi:hypothetical protein
VKDGDQKKTGSEPNGGDAPVAADGPPDRPERLESGAERRLRQIRGDLILELFLRRGSFWEAVRDTRGRLGVSARTGLPPRPAVGRLLPEDAPGPEDRKGYVAYATRWNEDMSVLRREIVPDVRPATRGDTDFLSERSWVEFLSACVLYDPPADRLVEFASHSDPQPTVLGEGRVPAEKRLKMVGAPVTTLLDLSKTGDWYWLRVLSYVGERYLEPQGVDVEDLIENAIWQVPGLHEEHLERAEWWSELYYVEVDGHTSLDDVKRAFRMIRSEQGSKVTKPPRDRLVAVQCTLLYDRHNRRLPEDGRRWEWTHEKLAEKFGLGSPRAAKAHVALGREIISSGGAQKDR